MTIKPAGSRVEDYQHALPSSLRRPVTEGADQIVASRRDSVALPELRQTSLDLSQLSAYGALDWAIDALGDGVENYLKFAGYGNSLSARGTPGQMPYTFIPGRESPNWNPIVIIVEVARTPPCGILQLGNIFPAESGSDDNGG